MVGMILDGFVVEMDLELGIAEKVARLKNLIAIANWN